MLLLLKVLGLQWAHRKRWICMEVPHNQILYAGQRQLVLVFKSVHKRLLKYEKICGKSKSTMRTMPMQDLMTI